MKQTKRQTFKEGSIIRIPLEQNKFAFARLLPGARIGVYDFIINDNSELPSMDEIVSKKIFIYLHIFKAIVTKKIFEIIGHIPLSATDLADIPPIFWQDLMDYKNCKLIWHDGRDRNATPEECIGLDQSIWAESAVIQIIQDHYAGRKTPIYELGRVILSEKDPRYMNPKVRWDFEKEIFVQE